MGKKWIIIMLGIFMVATVLFESSAVVAKEKTKCYISAKKIQVTVGESFEVAIRNAHSPVKWSVSNKNKVVIEKKTGNKKQTVSLLAKKKGNYVVKAKVGKKIFRCKVIVKERSVISEKKCTSSNTDGNKVTMSILVNDSNKEQLTIKIKNEMDSDVNTGKDFRLERLEGDQWKAVEFSKNTAFIAIGIIIHSSSEYEEIIQLSDYFEALSSGKYRIIKNVFIGSGVMERSACFEIV